MYVFSDEREREKERERERERERESTAIDNLFKQLKHGSIAISC